MSLTDRDHRSSLSLAETLTPLPTPALPPRFFRFYFYEFRHLHAEKFRCNEHDAWKSFLSLVKDALTAEALDAFAEAHKDEIESKESIQASLKSKTLNFISNFQNMEVTRLASRRRARARARTSSGLRPLSVNRTLHTSIVGHRRPLHRVARERRVRPRVQRTQSG